VSSDEDYARLSAIAKCPICGGKLEKGYINTPRYWTNERQPPSTIASEECQYCGAKQPEMK
jgi:hypothetical protein